MASSGCRLSRLLSKQRAGLGQATQRPAPHQPQAALVGGLHLGKQGRIAQPLAGHQNPGAAARCVFQQVAQQLA
jgi:hypothetical protein